MMYFDGWFLVVALWDELSSHPLGLDDSSRKFETEVLLQKLCVSIFDT